MTAIAAIASVAVVNAADDGTFLFDGAGGRCVVVEAGKDMKLVGVNRLGERPSAKYDFNEGGQPFFSGNRLFYRSHTDVYCIGNPAEPMRLSKGHL